MPNVEQAVQAVRAAADSHAQLATDARDKADRPPTDAGGPAPAPPPPAGAG